MKPILVFQTDFTYKEGAVCAMYGVVKSVDRTLEIIDGTHEIPQYDIWSASYRLYQSMKFWPKGTVFVSVVDPGVGTARRACVAKTLDGYYVVTPDNGTLTHLVKAVGIEAIREIDETQHRLKGLGTENTSVFHGRDLFGYCAAKLASGLISFEEVGLDYRVEDIRLLPDSAPTATNGKVEGCFEIGDPNFGNLWTNIPLSLFEDQAMVYGSMIKTTIQYQGEVKFEGLVPFYKSFGFVEKGQMVIYNNELMHISMALNQSSLVSAYGLSWGPEWRVTFEKQVAL